MYILDRIIKTIIYHRYWNCSGEQREKLIKIYKDKNINAIRDEYLELKEEIELDKVIEANLSKSLDINSISEIKSETLDA